MPKKSLRERAVRANPAYRLSDWTALPESARAQLTATVATMDGAAVLVAAAGSGLPPKLVDGRGAELFATFSRTARVPDTVSDALLRDLVLDAVLEVRGEHGWVAGPAAYDGPVERVDVPKPDDRLSRLGYQALERAVRMSSRQSDDVLAGLYAHGRVPVSTRWTRAYPGPAAVAAMFDLPTVRRDWALDGLDSERPGWLWFMPRGGQGPVHSARLVYKLYVSPHVDVLPAVLPVVAATLAATGAPHFKVGGSASGLLRPDKLVVYLPDAEELNRVAQALATALRGVAPHGVPFSADLAGDGLLSWGGDPPVEASPAGGGTESWRLSICRRLAEHVSAARREDLPRATQCEYALARLLTDGVRLPAFAPAALAQPAALGPTARAS